MKKITISTEYKKMLSDVFTPVGIYLRLRDRFRDTILLESADYSAADNSFSYIGINAIGGIEISGYDSMEIKYPGQKPQRHAIKDNKSVPDIIWNFMNDFTMETPEEPAVKIAQGFLVILPMMQCNFLKPFICICKAARACNSVDALPFIPIRNRYQSF